MDFISIFSRPFHCSDFKRGIIYIKENGKWLFQLRKYAVLYNDNGTGNMTGTANPYPELIT